MLFTSVGQCSGNAFLLWLSTFTQCSLIDLLFCFELCHRANHAHCALAWGWQKAIHQCQYSCRLPLAVSLMHQLLYISSPWSPDHWSTDLAFHSFDVCSSWQWSITSHFCTNSVKLVKNPVSFVQSSVGPSMWNGTGDCVLVFCFCQDILKKFWCDWCCSIPGLFEYNQN